MVNLNGTDTEDATISYSIEVPDNSQVYLSMTKLNFSNDKKKQVDIIVNGEKKSLPQIMLLHFLILDMQNINKLLISRLSSQEMLKYHLNLQLSIA